MPSRGSGSTRMTSPAANLAGRGVWFYPDGLTGNETIEFAQRLEALGR